jgi:hypothetical protein
MRSDRVVKEGLVTVPAAGREEELATAAAAAAAEEEEEEEEWVVVLVLEEEKSPLGHHGCCGRVRRMGLRRTASRARA